MLWHPALLSASGHAATMRGARSGDDCLPEPKWTPTSHGARSALCGQAPASRPASCYPWRPMTGDLLLHRFCYMNPDELRNTCEAPEEVKWLLPAHIIAPGRGCAPQHSSPALMISMPECNCSVPAGATACHLPACMPVMCARMTAAGRPPLLQHHCAQWPYLSIMRAGSQCTPQLWRGAAPGRTGGLQSAVHVTPSTLGCRRRATTRTWRTWHWSPRPQRAPRSRSTRRPQRAEARAGGALGEAAAGAGAGGAAEKGGAAGAAQPMRRTGGCPTRCAGRARSRCMRSRTPTRTRRRGALTRTTTRREVRFSPHL